MALPAMATPAARLLDFSQPLDVPLLDATVAVFYGAGSADEVRPRHFL
jgi:exportin-1